jgi:EpsI family protein
MIRRALVAAACICAAALYLSHALHAEPTPIREPLSRLPLAFDGWVGRDEAPFSDRVLAKLGADEYIARTYARPDALVSLYVGYYASQRQGETMHSPLNCLPGAGWQPVERGRVVLPVRAAPDGSLRRIEINQFVIQKGLDRQAVFYWYQSRDRVVASEYWGKVYTVLDAIRYNRTDAVLVRVIVPIGQADTARAAAQAAGASFVESLFPRLVTHLPL